jgi:hypothetical protein
METEGWRLEGEMKKNIVGENGIKYILGVDERYYPDLALPEMPEYEIGRYGMLRKKYLMEYRECYYYYLVTSCRLHEHLHEVDVECVEYVEWFVQQMAEQEGVDEQMKAREPMKWVGLMNNFRSMAHEVVMARVVCI